MSKLKKSIIKKYANGGKVKPIITNDPNDPRLQSYTDSLNLYRSTIEQIRDLQRELLGDDKKIVLNTVATRRQNGYYTNSANDYRVSDYKNDKIAPVGIGLYSAEGAKDYNEQEDYKWDVPIYKKPVQPVVYQPKQKNKPPVTSRQMLAPGPVGDAIRVAEFGPEKKPIEQPTQQTKIYTDEAEFKKANKAYQDSSLLHSYGNDQLRNLRTAKTAEEFSKKLYSDTRLRDGYVGLTGAGFGASPIKNVDIRGVFGDNVLGSIGLYKKPVVKPVYQGPIKEAPIEQPKPSGDHYQPTQYPNVQMVTTKDGKRFYENSQGQRMNYGQPITKDFQYQQQDMSKLTKSIKRKYANGGRIPKYYGGTSDLDYGSWGSNTDTSQFKAPEVQTYETDPYQQTPKVTSGNDAMAGSKGIANKGNPSASQVAGYAGYAATGIGLASANTGSDQELIAPRDQTWESGKQAVGAAVPAAAPYIALGSAGSQYGDQIASNQKNDTVSDFSAGVGGFMDPASGWSKRNAMVKNDELTDGEALMGTAMHFALPGLDSAYYNNKHRDYVKEQNNNNNQAPAPMTYDQMNPMFAGSKGIANGSSMFAEHGMRVPSYAYGGPAQGQQAGYPVVEYQGGESIYVPKGKGFVKYAQPKANKDNQHSNGGIQSPLPEGAIIFSKRFAKQADEAYAANDSIRMKALAQQQDNYNLRQGNPLNGTTDVTMRYGGRIRKYAGGTGNVQEKQMFPNVYGGQFQPWINNGNGYVPPSVNMNVEPPTSGYDLKYGQPVPSTQSNQNPVRTAQMSRAPYGGGTGQYEQPPTKQRLPYGTIASEALMFGAQNYGNFRDLNEAKNWDKVNYGTVNPEYLDPAQAIRSAKDQAAAARYNLRGVAGGNAGFYASNLRNVQTQRDKEIADTIYQYKNANAEIGNKSRYFNKEVDIRGQQDEAANKGAAHNITRAAYAQIGENAANQYRDYKGGRLNKYEADLFAQMYPNYPKSAQVPQELIDYYNYKNRKA